MISETQLFNLYSKELDKYFKHNMGFISVDDLREVERFKRIFTIVYTVEFPQNSTKEVSVSYKTTGTMDNRKTPTPLYFFNYILNPAKNWSDFKNLNIEIITPQKVPYVVDSNIELKMKEDRLYTAIFAGLPEDDLWFTLYAKEKITLKDKLISSFWSGFGNNIFFLTGVMGLFIWAAIKVSSKLRNMAKK